MQLGLLLRHARFRYLHEDIERVLDVTKLEELVLRNSAQVLRGQQPFRILNGNGGHSLKPRHDNFGIQERVTCLGTKVAY